jgi:hypothetical protein
MAYGLNVKPQHGYHVDMKGLDGTLVRVGLVDPAPDGPSGNFRLIG